MAYSHGTPNSIVKDGLTFAVDPANIRSYPRSGTVATDLINEVNGTLVNSPQFNSSNAGNFLFDGISEYISFGDIGLGGLTSFSFSHWVKYDSNAVDSNTWRISMGNSTLNTQGFLTGITRSGWSFNGVRFFFSLNADSSSPYERTGGINTDATNKVPITLEADVWYNVSGTWDGSTLNLYVNGNLHDFATYSSYTLPSSTSAFHVGSGNLGGSYAYGQQSANISQIQLYNNKALSTQEVKQNYNTLKGRFE